MSCEKIMQMFYECDKNDMPLLNQMITAVHVFFCPSCAQEIERYTKAAAFMKEDFFLETLSDSKSFAEIEDLIMMKTAQEELPDISAAQIRSVIALYVREPKHFRFASITRS